MGTPRQRRFRWSRLLLKLAVVALLGYAGLIIMLYALQTAMIFPRGGSIWRTPADPAFRWSFEDFTLDVQGERTCGWYVPVENARGTLLFCHANAGTMADRLESMAVFRDLGFNVFIFDYGGYGNSSGSPSEKRCIADALAAWQYLTSVKGEKTDRIVIFGRSLGGGVATQLAWEVRSTPPAALILESTFVSVVKMGQEIFPFVPVRWFIRDRFDSAARIGEVNTPVLIIHSPDDEIIPYHHGKRLFELAREPKTFLDIRGDHNAGWYDSGMVYTEGITRFLDSLVPSVEPNQ
ncbi:MAG: alpha/beta hydrolase [Candidatus Hydrogenedentes bacterium]|nr:alpha/beta hydrolase [Candidatus Hydrogenedentota bacterium]